MKMTWNFIGLFMACSKNATKQNAIIQIIGLTVLLTPLLPRQTRTVISPQELTAIGITEDVHALDVDGRIAFLHKLHREKFKTFVSLLRLGYENAVKMDIYQAPPPAAEVVHVPLSIDEKRREMAAAGERWPDPCECCGGSAGWVKKAIKGGGSFAFSHKDDCGAKSKRAARGAGGEQLGVSGQACLNPTCDNKGYYCARGADRVMCCRCWLTMAVVDDGKGGKALAEAPGGGFIRTRNTDGSEPCRGKKRQRQ